MTLALSRAELTDTSLTMPADASFEEWQEQGARLFTMERAVMWWIGDWWRFGERQYGEQASQAVVIGYSAGTVSNAAAVASRIEMPRRRGDLSFGHHQNVAYLSVDEQDYWLNEAEAGEWSVHELRTRVKRGQVDDEPLDGSRTESDLYDLLTAAIEILNTLRAHDPAQLGASVPPSKRETAAKALDKAGMFVGRIAYSIRQEDIRGT